MTECVPPRAAGLQRAGASAKVSVSPGDPIAVVGPLPQLGSFRYFLIIALATWQCKVMNTQPVSMQHLPCLGRVQQDPCRKECAFLRTYPYTPDPGLGLWVLLVHQRSQPGAGTPGCSQPDTALCKLLQARLPGILARVPPSPMGCLPGDTYSSQSSPAAQAVAVERYCLPHYV